MKCDKCGFDLDKFKLLKSNLKELDKKVKEAETAYETSKRFMELASKIQPNDPHGNQAYAELMKEGLTNHLEYLRLKIDRIQKVAPETAKILNKEVNNYEKSGRGLIEMYDKFYIKRSELTTGDFFQILASLIGVMQRTDELVNISTSSIKDVFEQIN